MRWVLRAAVAVAAAAVLCVLAGTVYGWWHMRQSLPPLDGTIAVPGLSAPVTVTRDALGVPAIAGTTRTDVAAALGLLHAHDRFFQMDLQRRQPAGELSALVGERAVEADARMRIHRFRHVARRGFERAEPEWRAVLEAYARGVNQGLATLAAPPFEYTLLGATPEPWQPEDSLLTVLAMVDRLQGRQMDIERTNQQLRDAVPEPLFRFLTQAGSEWETPVTGSGRTRPPVPGPDVVDLRARGVAARAQPHANAGASAWCAQPVLHYCAELSAEAAATLGSNNWAVDAAHSASGQALLANDMHLDINVPILWYRASLAYPDPAEPLNTLRVSGVTLPGLPPVVVGSTGFVAWGFTNTAGDWSDLVRIDVDPHDASQYLTPDGPHPFEFVDETIAVKDAPARTISIRSTIWGPVVWTDRHGHAYAQKWVAHDPDVLSRDLTRLERTRTVDEMLVAINGLGVPHQNLAMADHTGRVAWGIGGAIPRRRGWDGFTPESWASGTHGWDGYLDSVDAPRIVDPQDGRIWTANAPVVDEVMLEQIGDGGYSDGIRARIIRDRLRALPRATVNDMLAVQLDDTALFLERWRTLVLETLSLDEARTPVSAAAARETFRGLVEQTWTGRADPSSVAYRLVRTFRGHVVRLVMTFVTAPAQERDPSFLYARSPRSEGPVWDLVAARPMHLLDPSFASWDALLLAAVDAAIDELTADGNSLDRKTWGDVNRAQIAHPLASAVPLLGRWLTMPADPLPGDVFTPRAHTPRTGPSQRLVVSPGREEEGILHIPTGQSAHPLSPHFRDMHAAWLAGTPVPLLPGPTVHTLTLVPEGVAH